MNTVRQVQSDDEAGDGARPSSRLTDDELICEARELETHGGPSHGLQNQLAQALRELHAFRQRNAMRMREQHPDDLSVDAFAEIMKAKLAKKRGDGRGGWKGPDCSVDALSAMLREHVEKGDPVDVANFAMMLQQRGEMIAAASRGDGTPGGYGSLVAYILQEQVLTGMTPRVIDIAYSAFILGACGKNREDGGSCDWNNDTRPRISAMIKTIRRQIDQIEPAHDRSLRSGRNTIETARPASSEGGAS